MHTQTQQNDHLPAGMFRFTAEEAQAGQFSLGSRRILAEQLPSDVHIASEIPGFLAGYAPKRFRADEVSKPSGKPNLTGYYRTVDIKDAFQPVNIKVGITAWLPEVTPRSGITIFAMKFRGVCSFVNAITEDDATDTAWDPRMRAAARIANIMLLDREIDVWTMLRTAANWAANNAVTLGAGFNWNGGVNADPVADIETMVTNSVDGITDIYMSQAAAFAFIKAAAVSSQTRFMVGDRELQGSVQTIMNASRPGVVVDFVIPGFPPFHIVNSKTYNETTALPESILGADVVGVVDMGSDPTDGASAPTSRTFRKDGAGGTGWLAREWVENRRGPEGGIFMALSQAEVPVMIAANNGGLIKGVIQ